MKMLLLLLLSWVGSLNAGEPPYADYVRNTDGFDWKFQGKPTGEHFQLSLTSQNWHRATWTHTINVVMPAKSIAPDVVLIFVNGGAETLARMAGETGVACASVGGIYQPCFGQTGGEGIAFYALQQCTKTGDPTWSIAAATTKSLVRTMDALEAASIREGRAPFKRFILTGFSKMGMASWLGAVMDSRVIGIVPIGADLLNTVAQMEANPKVVPQLANISAAALAILDPYSYREKLRAAKLVISGTNDEHYDLGSVGWFWGGLPGPKWNLYLDNADHAKELHDSRTVRGTVAFVRAIATGKLLPALELRRTVTAGRITLHVTTSAPGKSARLYSTKTNGEFKFAKWNSTPMQASADRKTFTGAVEQPATGRAGAYAEVEFEQDGQTFALTTEASIHGR